VRAESAPISRGEKPSVSLTARERASGDQRSRAGSDVTEADVAAATDGSDLAWRVWTRSVKKNVEPWPFFELTSTLESSDDRIRWQMLRPRPAPENLLRGRRRCERRAEGNPNTTSEGHRKHKESRPTCLAVS